MTFFKLLEELDPNQNNVCVTALSPEECGQRLVFSEGKCIWSSGGLDPAAWEELLSRDEKTGAFALDGRAYFAESLGR